MSAYGTNRFFIWRAEAARPSEFSPDETPDGGASDVRYFYGLLRELDRLLAGRGITFLLTWQLDRFDARLRDSVVLLIGDEKYQAPSYLRSVRAVFKTGGTRRNPLQAALRLEPGLAWRVLLRELRNSALAVRRGRETQTAELRTGAAGAGPMYELPMGYYGLTEVPFVPFGQRQVDVFFAGSIERGAGFTVRPRLAARRQMSTALEAAGRRLPDVRISCRRSGPFANPAEMLDPASYSERLMQAKIALCPRGNFDETFRLCEAAKLACVAITEPLPSRWYNADAPAVQLERWSSLPAVLEELLSDPAGLARRSERMREWWRDRLSERAVARYIVERLPGVSA